MDAVLHLHLVQLLPVSLQSLNGIHDLCSGLIRHPYLWLGNILTGQDGTQDASQLGWGQALHDTSYRANWSMALRGKGSWQEWGQQRGGERGWKKTSGDQRWQREERRGGIQCWLICPLQGYPSTAAACLSKTLRHRNAESQSLREA